LKTPRKIVSEIVSEIVGETISAARSQGADSNQRLTENKQVNSRTAQHGWCILVRTAVPATINDLINMR